MNCHVRSADRVLYEGRATLVVARSDDGEFAVMENHAPLLATLRPGAVRIVTGDSELVFACLGGVLRVDGNDVSISARRAVAAADIDRARVEERLTEIAGLPAIETDPRLRQERDDLLVLRAVGGSDA
jgi:F-type H+-transporting ATPase subunit epsilon